MPKQTRRNGKDIIMELVHLHIDLAQAEGRPVSPERLEEIFLKYYGLYINRDRELRQHNRR